MTNLPEMPSTSGAPVLRCDFTSDESWAQTWSAITATTDDFQMNVVEVQDPRFDGLGQEEFLEITRRLPEDYPHPVLYFADAVTMADPEHTLLVTWAWKDEYEGQFFRCLPADVLAIENNVVDNMPWEEFYEAVGEDGVCRTD